VTLRSLTAWASALAAMAAFFGFAAASPADTLSASQTAQVNAIVKSAMAKQHLVGAEIAIGRNGTLLFTQGYGLRDRATGLPVTANTIFPIGSITKQFTATCVMQLVQQGKTNLDAKVARYLPEVPHASQITVRELLDQTSGLQDYLDNKPLLRSIEAGTARTPHAPQQLLALIDGMPLLFTPGTKFMYSNTNYLVLGMLVAKLSGEPYERYLRQSVLLPHGLEGMQYLAWSIPSGSDVTRGYTFAKGVNSLVPRYEMSWGGAAGALASTAAELVRWDGLFFGDKVITARSVSIATTPPAGIPVLRNKDPRNNFASGYAFGWMNGSDEGRAILWHNGGIIGARTMNLVFPRDGLEVIVLTNATQGEPESIALKIARMLYAQ
jgi:D-alanyl-D-alanine carboxypeptidase